jgi:hypothetical protein
LKNKNCLNCNLELSESSFFCSNCGQKIDSPIVRFKDFLKDAFEDYFSIDSKIFKSIVPLLFKPGFLTIEYIKGKRTSYITPFRMFLIISILYFIYLSFDREEQFHVIYNAPPTANITDSSVNVTNKNSNSKDKLNLSLKMDSNRFDKIAIIMASLKDSSEQAYISKNGLKVYTDSVMSDENFLYRYISKKLFAMYLSEGKNFGDLMFRSVQKLVFIMAPIMAFILMLIYFRKKIFYMQHLIFSFHFHAFVFLIFFLFDIFLLLLDDFGGILVILSMLLYLLIAIKKVYLQGWMRSILNFGLLFLGYILLGIPILLALTIFSAILLY